MILTSLLFARAGLINCENWGLLLSDILSDPVPPVPVTWDFDGSLIDT